MAAKLMIEKRKLEAPPEKTALSTKGAFRNGAALDGPFVRMFHHHNVGRLRTFPTRPSDFVLGLEVS